ncbi:hypothetical protein, partial [Rhizobium leguminosarum]|uniref:hypothetical protein n=1 Tax=Rhizobium leguminosarum TaxID=384 RepID=UPI001C982C00
MLSVQGEAANRAAGSDPAPFFSPAGSNHVSNLPVLWRPFGLSNEDSIGENDEFAGDGYDRAQVFLP